MFALLIRSYFQKDDNEIRPTLTIEQTQQLIDVAIALHDKEIQRRQMNSYQYPLIIALIALSGTIFTPFATAWLNRDNNRTVDHIDQAVQRIESQLKTSTPSTIKNSDATKPPTSKASK
jgi:ribosome-associated translation inhibitor RaiA